MHAARPQVDDPAVAALLLQEHDDLVANCQRPHRVTEFFCGRGKGSLRPDMEAHAAGQGMSSRLASEVRAYQLCKVDDTWAEAAHRDVSNLTKRATAAKVAYTAASLRLPQTLAMLEKAQPAFVANFCDFMRKYKAIGQMAARPARALRSAHKKVRVLQSFVYRTDRAGHRDWGMDLDQTLQMLDNRSVQRRSMVQRLQLEHLASAVSNGDMLSLPCAEILQQVESAPLASVPALLHQGPTAADTFFQAVDVNAGRKKQLRTAAMGKRHASMAKPILLQRTSVWATRSEANAPRQVTEPLVVFNDGYPEIVDLLDMASWRALRHGLRKWQVGPAQLLGCVALSAPSLASGPSDWRDAGTSALRLLEELAVAGWTRGPAPLHHTPDSDKQFSVADPIARKAYLRCLLSLQQLVGEGKLASLQSDQPASYYACVLASCQPHLVPVNRSAAEYKQLLVDGHDGMAAARLGREASQASSTSSSEDVVVVGERVGQRGHGRGRGRGRGEGRSERADQDWSTLIFAGPALADSPTANASPARPVVADRPSAPSAAGSSKDPPPPTSTSGPSSEARPEQASAASAAKCWLEGSAVAVETHGVLGQPGSYRRLVVRCMHHATKGAPCRKTRAFGVRSVGQLGLGDAEPYAFLGAWLREHASFKDSEAHKRFTPTGQQVAAYATEMLGHVTA